MRLLVALNAEELLDGPLRFIYQISKAMSIQTAREKYFACGAWLRANPKMFCARTPFSLQGLTGGGAIAEAMTKAKPKITAAMTMATARLPFFSSSHSSTGVSQVKTDSKIQSERAMVRMPTAPQPMSFR
jgi:hypothetical protein